MGESANQQHDIVPNFYDQYQRENNGSNLMIQPGQSHDNQRFSPKVSINQENLANQNAQAMYGSFHQAGLYPQGGFQNVQKQT